MQSGNNEAKFYQPKPEQPEGEILVLEEQERQIVVQIRRNAPKRVQIMGYFHPEP